LFLVKYYRDPPLPKKDVKEKGGKAQLMKTVKKGGNDEKEKQIQMMMDKTKKTTMRR